MLELYEEDIEDWFFHHRSKMSLERYLCEGIVLKNESKRESIYLIKRETGLNYIFLSKKVV